MQKINISTGFINEFIKLIEIDQKDFNIKQILADYANWDSLAIVSMIAMVEQYFCVKIQGNEIESCLTLEDIFLQIQKKQN